MSDANAPAVRVDPLDAALVLASTALLGGVVVILAFVHVPQENLPILASIASGIFGSVLSGYAGFRWGASVAGKPGPMASAPSATSQTINVAAPVDPNAPSAPVDPSGLDIPPKPGDAP